jgi:hypothetical protein
VREIGNQSQEGLGVIQAGCLANIDLGGHDEAMIPGFAPSRDWPNWRLEARRQGNKVVVARSKQGFVASGGFVKGEGIC